MNQHHQLLESNSFSIIVTEFEPIWQQ